MSRYSKKKRNRAKIYTFLPTGDYYFHKGLQSYDRFDFTNAKKYLQRALELEPLEPMIACQLALVHTETGEYEKSNQLLLMTLNELDERMTECYYFLANNYAHLGLFTEAYRYAKLYLEKDEVGEFADEAEELLEWIGINDDDITLLKEQEELLQMQEESKSLLEEGKYAEAVQMLEDIVKAYPEFWPAYNNLALAYFYEGETSKAFSMTEKVIAHNPGNLHALCNLAVFYFYEHQTGDLERLLKTLEKIKPIIPEHRYKLGATFALAKQYELAYFWLRQLQKSGYPGNAGFYYWLAKAAYFTGNEKAAKAAWDRLVLLEPEKAGIAPWNESLEEADKRSEGDQALLKLLRSESIAERLCGIFFISISDRQPALLTHPSFKSIEEFSYPEKLYLATILQVEKRQVPHAGVRVDKAHETATELYERHKDRPADVFDLLKFWFGIVRKVIENEGKFANPSAFAAAAEYVWSTEKNEGKTQREIAKQYGISTATLRKYITKIELYL
ncbi:MAG TPA: tetratricopeptide repeat protein [Bacillus bacterium]|uniref:TPR repeat-containing protein YvcD n=1 Tax=Siminovitchia fordii TaxID=254759 RepID=A0ABQ4K458_9BACI|nr:tetratricopeptide repeat protein [Siminovitchia fordii]GIN19716.1 TPR repeat-containing protein YvcD [Siminovitchia fordii]HBZ11381.1 tetratricopeptide repeat protein [Bacillus sp. (in: firmicutes)]